MENVTKKEMAGSSCYLLLALLYICVTEVAQFRELGLPLHFFTNHIKANAINYQVMEYNGKYDGNPHTINVWVKSPTEGATITYSTEENGAYVSEKPTRTDVGTTRVYFKITAPNYLDAIYYGEIVINPADIAFDIAANEDVYYDGNAHASATVSSLNPADATVKYTCNGQTYTEIPSFTEVGTYQVSYEVTRENYEAKRSSYTFTIKSGIIAANGTDCSEEYDGNPHTITVTVSQPDGTSVSYSEEENGTYIDTAPTLTNVGSKTVYWKVEKAGYTTVAGSNTVTITAKPVTITVDNKEKNLGDTDPAFTGTVTGLVDENDLGIVTYSRADSTEAVGTYEISASYDVTTAGYQYNDETD